MYCTLRWARVQCCCCTNTRPNQNLHAETKVLPLQEQLVMIGAQFHSPTPNTYHTHVTDTTTPLTDNSKFTTNLAVCP